MNHLVTLMLSALLLIVSHPLFALELERAEHMVLENAPALAGGDHNHNHNHDHHHGHDHASHSSTEGLLLDGIGETDGAQPIWTCPMHPQIQRDRAGSCPICGMDLVQRATFAADSDVTVPTGIQQAMNVRVAEVRRDRLWRHIDTVGHIGYDESRLQHLHPRVEGWIQELNVVSVGDQVSAGMRLLTLYSPQLVNAQKDFLLELGRGDEPLIDSTRKRLGTLDIQPRVIAWIEENRQVMDPVPWYAQQDGYVSRLGARHGMYVTPDTEIMEIADLSWLWLEAEVFDRQAGWLEPGQPAEIRFAHAPGEVFESEVGWVYPQVDPTTRAVRVRLALENTDGSLKAGMWAEVRIFGGPIDDQIIIPREALIRTGLSERVVIRVDERRFAVREVVAGMESGDYVAIQSGLETGEQVVTSGQFLIDSEASIRAGHDRLGGGHVH